MIEMNNEIKWKEWQFHHWRLQKMIVNKKKEERKEGWKGGRKERKEGVNCRKKRGELGEVERKCSNEEEQKKD